MKTTPMDEMLENIVRDLHAMRSSQHAPMTDRIAVKLHQLALVVQDMRATIRRPSLQPLPHEAVQEPASDSVPLEVFRQHRAKSDAKIQEMSDLATKYRDSLKVAASALVFAQDERDRAFAACADKEVRRRELNELKSDAVNLQGDIVARGPNKTSTEMLDEVARALGWRTDWACGDSPITWDAALEEVKRRSSSLRHIKVECANEATRRREAEDLVLADEEVIVELRREVRDLKSEVGGLAVKLSDTERRAAQVAADDVKLDVLDMVARAATYDDKPHQLYSHLATIAKRHGNELAQDNMLAKYDDASGRVRDARQAKVFAWARDTFGVGAVSVPQRGIRLLEEALEAYQAAGCDQTMAHELVDYVFKRPVGELAKELGGVGVCALALAASAGLNADYEEELEVKRVLDKPAEEWRARHTEKAAAGLAHAQTEAP